MTDKAETIDRFREQNDNSSIVNIPTVTTQFVIWNADGVNKLANVIFENTEEARYLLELIMELRDDSRARYCMSVV